MTAATDIVVRPAIEEDAEALFDAWVEVREHYASVDARIILAEVSLPEFAQGLRERISRRDTATIVAVIGGRVVGFITGGVEPGQPDRLPAKHAAVGHLYVQEGLRRQSIGSQLFRALAAWARDQDGAAHFEMTVLDADDEARHFWAAIGFRPFIQRLWAPIEATGDSP